MTLLPAALGGLDEAVLRRYEADPSLSKNDWALVVGELARRGAVSPVTGRPFPAPQPWAATQPATQPDAPRPHQETSATPQHVVITDIRIPFGRLTEILFQYAFAAAFVAIILALAGGIILGTLSLLFVKR